MKRLALVGCGAVTELCHLPALLSPDPPFRVTALVDRDPSRLRAVAGALGHPVDVFADVGELPGRVDAALVATGPASHAAIAGRLAAAGTPVLVEKPVALTVPALAQLRTSGTPVVPAHVRRLYPATGWVAAQLASGRLGRLRRIRWREGAVYAWPAASPFTFSPGPGGGVLADLGPHILDLLAHWLGGPGEPLSYADNSDGGAASEAELRLAFGDVTAEVTLSRLRTLENRIVFEGTAGTLTVGTERAASQTIDGQPPEPVPAPDPALLTRAGLFRHQLVLFGRGIQGEPVPELATLADAEATVALLDRCRPTSRVARLWEPAEPPRPSPPLGTMRVAVTGANGFIGAHVVEHLLDAGAREVVAVTRTHAGRARLAHRAPGRLRFARADTRDAVALEEAFRGCDVVVHAVYGSRGEPAERWSVTVDGTAAAVTAATRAGARRVVHVSSAAVYRTDSGPVLTEDSPALEPAPDDLSYAAQKAAAERLALHRAGGPAEVVCLQPAAVYGPFGPVWTVRPLRLLRADNACLPSGGGGTCDVVHVHDVAGAITHLVTAPAVDGRRFLLAGPAATTWGDYYDRYRDLLGQTQLDLPDSANWPQREREFFRRVTRIDGTRLAETGFRPAITLDEGLATVAAWSRWAGLS
ncbi:hypothetical protein GCM10010112_48910 [Actinoplanes lobatus]|uniref:Nucleoside-diphosphate-sugar epimerase n=1 Tax=Actinoplanes lobatus TaxID=113568 RepID=A0A7W7MLF6_9ACTN|nr:NAD-dependent epimerase/dehydratase family protein [Actinoplanes lobatus]MBB4754050.1 nucleoside-diphosphate-sugar epimerase [Actinoplanes lobatus]GGN76602.1 hypothetical protein GCM10010112_48910 [Actinoplanes lobatus]GIE40894.1 hypothetical protein Alo02nite_37920 [Actinoplanes lobatus]